MNELTMYEQNADYRREAMVRRGDNTLQAYAHPGGYTDTLRQINLEHIRAYKSKYYQEDTINFCARVRDVEAVKHHCLGWDNSQWQRDRINNRSDLNELINYQVKCTPARRALSWWVPQSYLKTLLACIEQVAKEIGSFGELYMTEESNDLGHVALRLLCNKDLQLTEQTVKELSEKLYSELSKYPLKADSDEQIQTQKLPQWVMDMASKPAEHKTAGDFQLSSPSNTPICDIPIPKTASALPQHDVHSSRLAESLSSFISLDNVPPLPTFFADLKEVLTGSTSFVSNRCHWLFELTVQDEGLLMSCLIEPASWQPRTGGQCYAMGLARDDGRYFLYGAQDTQIATRKDWLKSLVY